MSNWRLNVMGSKLDGIGLGDTKQIAKLNFDSHA